MNDKMMNGCACTPNRAIRCTVEKCANHCKSEAYCEKNPTMDQCPDCQSFTPMQ